MKKDALVIYLLLFCASCQGFQKGKNAASDAELSPIELKIMTFNIWTNTTLNW